MKFSPGDRIILKRTGEEGTVTGFIGKDMLEVEVGGVHFPVYADEVDHPYLTWFTEVKKKAKKTSLPEQLPVEKEKEKVKRLPKGIYLSFLPVFKADEIEDIVSSVKIHLLNETPIPVKFSYEMRLLQASAFKLEGTLHAFGNLYLHAVDYGDMNDQPRFHWMLSDASTPGYATENGILKIKPSRLFEHVSKLLLKNEATFSYKLLEDFVLETSKPKPDIPTVPPRVIELAGKPVRMGLQDLPRTEIDLHIENLTDDIRKLSNAEMITLQLRTLEKYLHLAIVHRLEKMVVVHGIGTGALKDAVHKMLKSMPEVKSFRNEWMGRYGYGATEVIFRR
ncbi:MAG: hypothetical protein EOP49_04165 [Sphingobacteriales bacterium]|nr:MAG: hypothetical protein EOP49_04165 [Sphingobacteriales bacterium]